MARTALTDVNFQSNTFKRTLNAFFVHKLGIMNGLMAKAPDEFISPNDIGYTSTLPRWNFMTGTWKTISTSLSTEFNKLTDYIDVGVWIEREIAFQAEQILLTVAGKEKDVTIAVAEQLGDFIAKTFNDVGTSVLKGTFADALLSTHVYTEPDNGSISVNGIASAKNKIGDSKSILSSIIMHSKVETDALIDKILTYDKASVDSFATGKTGNLQGLVPFVSDLLEPVDGVYTNYIGAKGSLIFQIRDRKKSNLTNANIIKVGNIELELVRDSTTAGGIDGIIIRYSGMFHVPGVKWNGTVASNPTDAQLETGANWTKVAPDNRLIPLVAYKVK